VYTRGLVKDGNFTAVHLIQKNPDDDVWLAEGQGFMASQERYQNHLKVAKEYKEACLTLYFHIRCFLNMRIYLVGGRNRHAMSTMP
jgi:hypothetical protein